MKTPTEFAEGWSEESTTGFPAIQDLKLAADMLEAFALHVLDEVEKRKDYEYAHSTTIDLGRAYFVTIQQIRLRMGKSE